VLEKKNSSMHIMNMIPNQLNKLLALYTYRSILHIYLYTIHNTYYFSNLLVLLFICLGIFQTVSSFVLGITVYKLFVKLMQCTIVMIRTVNRHDHCRRRSSNFRCRFLFLLSCSCESMKFLEASVDDGLHLTYHRFSPTLSWDVELHIDYLCIRNNGTTSLSRKYSLIIQSPTSFFFNQT
jgi:hypothetical protein